MIEPHLEPDEPKHISPAPPGADSGSAPPPDAALPATAPPATALPATALPATERPVPPPAPAAPEPSTSAPEAHALDAPAGASPPPGPASAATPSDTPSDRPSDAPLDTRPDAPSAAWKHPVQRITALLDARGLHPAVLVGLGLGAAGIAVLCLLVRHPGLGGVFGLLALGLSALGLAPREGAVPPVDPLARGSALVVELGLLAGIVVQGSAAGRGLLVFLGLVVLILSAWLPHLKASGPHLSIPPHAGLWRRSERLAIVMLGLLTGRTTIALVLVAAIGTLDAVFRLDRLRTHGGRRWRPRFLEPLVAEDGTLEPVVRWGLLLVSVLLLAVLPRESGWRF